jgi:hypothetical protein
VVVDGLVRLGSGAPMPQVRAIAAYLLEQLARRPERSSEVPGESTIEARAHNNSLRRDIRRFLERPGEPAPPWPAPATPPGSPIGDPGSHWLHHSHGSEQMPHTGW